MVGHMTKIERYYKLVPFEPPRAHIVMVAFQEMLFQRPGVAESALAELADRALTWTVGNFEWLLELSAEDLEGLRGFDPEIDDEADEELGELELLEPPPELLAVEVPENFNPLVNTGPHA